MHLCIDKDRYPNNGLFYIFFLRRARYYTCVKVKLNLDLSLCIHAVEYIVIKFDLILYIV